MDIRHHNKEHNNQEFATPQEQFLDILQRKLIHSVYQPIVSLKDGSVLGYEALTRGPENSLFHSPMKLFPYAEKAGVLYSLEKIAREMAIKGAFFSKVNEMLFINISAAIIQDPYFAPGKTLDLLQERGLKPGNIVFEWELTRRLMEKKPFSVLYADLDYFKWFNDQYGFQKGDQLIQFTADVIGHSIAICGKPDDFVGHIGGDDFIMITSTDESQKICDEIIRRFDLGVPTFYAGDDWTYVVDRKGNRIETSGVTISMSLIVCGTEGQITLEEISQSAVTLKKLSKASPGSVCCSNSIGLSIRTSTSADRDEVVVY